MRTMAKKKKGTRRKSYKKKRRSAPKKSMPVGAAAGSTITAVQILAKKTDEGWYSPLEVLFLKDVALSEKISRMESALTKNATDLDRYGPLLVGALVSASPRLPVVGIAAKPLNRMIKKMSKGKWGL